jgi:ABC-type transport system involved in multi-copper enzyme maturation permease subunit
MNRVCFSPRRLLFIAHNTLREAVRQKVLTFLLVLALVLLAGAHACRDLHFGSPELKFLADLGTGALGAFGAVLTVVATAQLFLGELERRTALTLLAKPVSRAEFVLGKFVGVAVLVGGFCGVLTLLLAVVLWTRETAVVRAWPGMWAGGRLVNYAHLALTGSLTWLKLVVLAALTLLVASYARTQLFTIATGLLAFVICQLQPLLQAASMRAGHPFAGVSLVLVAHAVPNFQLFNLAETSGGSAMLPWTSFVRVALYAAGYVASACGLAVYCFRRREI